MTLHRARALIEAAKKATKGKWIAESRVIDITTRGVRLWTDVRSDSDGHVTYVGEDIAQATKSRNDAAFIALSHNDAPAIAEALVEACELLKTIAKIDGADNITEDETTYSDEWVAAMNKLYAFLAKMENDNG